VRIVTCPNHAFPINYSPLSARNFSGAFAAPADVVKHSKGSGTHST
jgi:hypothetical protein